MSVLSSLLLSVAIVVTPAPLAAQAVVQPLPGTTDADRLGEQMRALAANPNDVNALITAGDLSLKLDDLSAAASLFARAEKVDPRNARLKAGEASVLVRSERPGEALRYFAQAQAMGLDQARFAGDRGLAYDLIGEQERAQRDYRLALRQGPNEEVTRRYALSLGISGKRDLALEQLDPLLRETDRGAWRARAFVLAMAGDVPGAERIATTMMPPGMAEGLQPFFQRLPSLPAIDRAFAVHFGEVVASPERIADARLAPPMAALGPDPYAPVQVTRVAVASAPAKPDKRKRGKQKPGRVELAAAVVPTAAAPALPPPPAYSGQPVAIYEPPSRPTAAPNATARANAQQLAAIRTDMPAARTAPVATTPVARPVALASARSASRAALAPAVTSAPRTTDIPREAPPTSAPAPTPIPPRVAAAVPTVSRPAPVIGQTASPTSQPTPVIATPQPTRVIASPAPALVTPSAAPAAVATASVNPAPISPTPAPPAGTEPPSPAPATTALAAADVTPSTPVEAAASARVFATSEPAASLPVAATTTATPPVTGPRDSADAILARIIAGLSIPASELEVRTPTRATPVAAPAADVLAEAKAKEARDAAAAKLVADKVAADKKKAALDKKALAAKKLADDKKAADAKAAAEAKKLARANPARIWVQVAGGANEGDLPKAYAAVKAKAPAAFAGRSGWSTPLRATNRVLTGPFKTDAEARAFVNTLAKQGVSAFTFTSDDGQQVTRLPAK